MGCDGWIFPCFSFWAENTEKLASRSRLCRGLRYSQDSSKQRLHNLAAGIPASRRDKVSAIRHLARRVVNIGVCHEILKEADAAVEKAIAEELKPLLEAVQAAVEINSGATRFNLEQELKKWQ